MNKQSSRASLLTICLALVAALFSACAGIGERQTAVPATSTPAQSSPGNGSGALSAPTRRRQMSREEASVSKPTIATSAP